MIRYLLALMLAIPLAAQTATINGQRANFRVLVGSAAPSSGTCDAASERGSIYLRTGDQASVPSQVYVCKQSGASTYGWGPAGWVAQATAPATCVVGDLYFDTDATAGENLNLCTATNTWTTVTSGGGGTGDAASPVTVSYSATPTFTADSNTANVFTITLTGNVTSCTLSSFTTGQVVVLKIVQDGTGGRTFACTGFSGLGAISTVASKTSIQTFVATSASSAVAVGPMVSDETAYAVSFVPSGDATLTLPSGTKSLIAAGDLATKLYAHDTGGDDTYAANPVGGTDYCPSALADGVTVELVVDTTNTGSATFDLCGLGALEISAALDGTDLTSGDLVVGKPYLLRYYDTTTDLWIVTLPGAGSGGLTLTTSGQGYLAIPNGAIGGVTTAAAYSSKVPKYLQFVVPFTLKVTSIGWYVHTSAGTCGGGACGFAAAIYDASCNKVSGSDATTSTSFTGGVKWVTLPSPVTLTPGVYHLGSATDSSALIVYGASDGTVFTSIIQDSGTSGALRWFTGSNNATGDNGTLAMPSACGTKSAASHPIEISVLVP